MSDTKPPQARNAIGRALLHTAGIHFSDGYKRKCKQYFNYQCAYCGKDLGSQICFDHAESLNTETEHFHLVCSCPECNSNEKREKNWNVFLREKCKSDEYQNRKNIIEDWLNKTEGEKLIPEHKKIIKEAIQKSKAAFNVEVEMVRQEITPYRTGHHRARP